MHIAVPKEVYPGETRVALIPEHVARLIEMGAQISVETGIGRKLNFSDDCSITLALHRSRESASPSADFSTRIYGHILGLAGNYGKI